MYYILCKIILKTLAREKYLCIYYVVEKADYTLASILFSIYVQMTYTTLEEHMDK